MQLKKPTITALEILSCADKRPTESAGFRRRERATGRRGCRETPQAGRHIRETAAGLRPPLPPALPLAAEAGEAAVALQAVALQETLHRGGVEGQTLGGERIAQFLCMEIAGRASRIRKMRSRSGSIREALPPIAIGPHMAALAEPLHPQCERWTAPSPKCRAAAAALQCPARPRPPPQRPADARRPGGPAFNSGSPRRLAAARSVCRFLSSSYPPAPRPRGLP